MAFRKSESSTSVQQRKSTADLRQEDTLSESTAANRGPTHRPDQSAWPSMAPWVVNVGSSFPRKKQNRALDILQRNRIPAAAVSVVLVLYAVVRLSASTHSPASNGNSKYAVVFDAGSTGSRVHTYSFEVQGSDLILLNDDFHQLKPGLSSYAGNPHGAAESLRPLLESAIKAVPKEFQAQTTCELRATAGLRLLPGTESQDILAAVFKFLKASPFHVDDSSVTILDGQDEGAYAWLTLNYLLGKLGGSPSQTVTAIDLGGGSVQESYAVEQDDARKAPEGYIKELNGGNLSYQVYVHSYLSFGLMAARAQILKGSQETGSPCVVTGYEGEYTYGGEKYTVKPQGKLEDGSECRKLVKSVLELKTPCDAPADQCSFQGAWGGPGVSDDQTFYLFSYFWDRAIDSGIIDKPGVHEWQLPTSDYTEKSDMVCKMDLNQVTEKFPHVKKEDLPYMCMDLSFCSVLLDEGFGIPRDDESNLVRQIEYRGQTFEMAWTLGAAINSLGR